MENHDETEPPAQFVPGELTSTRMKLLADHLKKTFSIMLPDGSIDLDRAQRCVAYSIGNIYVNYNGLLMTERIKQAEIDGEVAMMKASVLSELKKGKIPHDLNATQWETMLVGNREYVMKIREQASQAAYVKFLENCMRQISTYREGVKVILDAHREKSVYGQ
jgi:hypothetical protein